MASDLRENATTPSEVVGLPWEYLLHEQVTIVVFSVACVADIFMIYCIARFKNMRTKRNLIILNWTAADLLFQFSNIFIIALAMRSYMTNTIRLMSCMYIYIEPLSTACFFVLCLKLNFVYKNITSRVLKIACPLIWTISVIYQVVPLVLCTYDILPDEDFYVFNVMYLLLSCTCLAKTLLYLRRRLNHNEKQLKLRYILTFGFVLCWLPNVIQNRVLDYVDHRTEFFLLYMVTECCGCANSILNVYLLAKFDKNFRICLLKIFKCSSSSYVDSSVSYLHNACDANINNSPSLRSTVNAND